MKAWYFGFSLVVATLVSTVSRAQSYPMSCRGGGTIGLNGERRTAVLYFSKSSGPAGAGLQAGQCSWLDRAIGSGEPPCLEQYNVKAVAWITPNNMPSATASTSTHFQPNEPRAQWMRSLLSSANYQTFQVYNPGNGRCFVVTSP